MAYAVKRAGGYAGYYRDAHGRRMSAGVFPTKAEAIVRASDREGSTVVGRAEQAGAVPDVGTYAEYVEQWLVDVRGLMPRTINGYENEIRNHVLPLIGHLQVASLTKRTMTEMFEMLDRQGLGAHTRVQCKCAVGRSLRPLVPDVLPFNPTHGIVIDLPPGEDFQLLTPEDFAKVWAHLSGGRALFAAILVSTGARFGEAAEIRVRDVNFRTNEFSISRRLVQTGGRNNDGSRFAVYDGTKAGRKYGRTIVLPQQVADDLRQWIEGNGLTEFDLVFPSRLIATGKRAVDIGTGTGKPFTAGGRTYYHGTPYGYTGGGCRCGQCLSALRRYRKAAATSNVRSQPKDRGRNLTGHLPHDHWRDIWYAACDASGIGWRPRIHDCRHAYATQLVASGVSIYEVKTLMGHRLIETTLRYLHRVESMQSKAIEAAGAFTMGRPEVG